MIYGYVRVSAKEQNTDRQIAALRHYNIKDRHIYTDYQSGKDFDRTEYKRLIEKLKNGDVLVIKSIDRLGRNYAEILEQWRYITKTIEADIIVIDMPLLDTTQYKDLVGTLISDIILQILCYVAENERTLIHQRQLEGIAIAKANGVKSGRPAEFNATDYVDIYRQYSAHNISIDNAMSLIGCGRCTFYRMLNELKQKSLI